METPNTNNTKLMHDIEIVMKDDQVIKKNGLLDIAVNSLFITWKEDEESTCGIRTEDVKSFKFTSYAPRIIGGVPPLRKV